ncbi:MAG: hypothetical protein JXA36_02365, partial [Coriobacteriia bacterium]|nr:hypothetical protein [Coriobacteriia bacterium]
TAWRYFLTPKAGVALTQMFVNGAIYVEIAPNSWSVIPTGGASTPVSGSSYSAFTIDSTAEHSGSDPNAATTLGPLTLKGPSIGLADTSFRDGKLVLKVSIGANEATVAVAGSSLKLTGVLGTFDLEVDIATAMTLLEGSAEFLNAFSVPGRFSLNVASLVLDIQNTVIVEATGIKVNYDPAYKAEEHNGDSQLLLEVRTVSIKVVPIDITGSLDPYIVDAHGPGTVDDEVIPGLRVYSNGFRLGRGELKYAPVGGIKLGGILEFDDIRVGIEDFSVFDGQVSLDGSIYIASGGAKFLPGKPVNGTIVDRKTAEPSDIVGSPNTEALRAALTFEANVVKGFVFEVDTLTINIASVVTLTARDFRLNTAAGSDEWMVEFGSVGAEVSIGGSKIGGEGRNFGFKGDGSFDTKPGFGVFLTIGGVSGDDFNWPTWLPIHVTEIGIEWRDIKADPADIIITVSASITKIPGLDSVEISGGVKGMKIDIGLLRQGKFPVVSIDSFSVKVAGDMFGGKISAALVLGIIKMSESGAVIGTFDATTPVYDRVLYAALDGSFEMAGMAGFSIRLALSELGPLGVQLGVSLPTGIIIHPPTGLCLNDFVAGVEFFKTLPAITSPFDLRGSAFNVPSTLSVDEWRAGIESQVAAQWRAIQANPNLNGFTAAFTSPMLITGSARVYSIYTSKELFNGQVVVKISTDGKFLIIGKLNFAADNISMSGKLYADISRISQGEATVLFLADVPDDPRILTLYGKLQMGFRDATGAEVVFVVPEMPPAQPTATLAGPADGDKISLSEIDGRGFIDVSYAVPAGYVLDEASITDLGTEFVVSATGGTVTVDETQAPLLINGDAHTYRYWVISTGAPTGLVLTWVKNSWALTNTTSGETEGNEGIWVVAPGVALTTEESEHNAAVAGSSTVSSHVDHLDASYIDVRFSPSEGQTVDEGSIMDPGAEIAFVNSAGVALPIAASSSIAPTRMTGNYFRVYLSGNFGATGAVTARFAAGSWTASGIASAASEGSFTIVDPQATIAAPFVPRDTDGDGDIDGDDRPALDVEKANGALHEDKLYVDVIYTPTPGNSLDYASIMGGADGAEITITGAAGIAFEVNPLPIAMVANAESGILEATVITRNAGESDSAYYARLAAEGITQFRYMATTTGRYVPSEITIAIAAASWADDGGNMGAASTYVFRIEGPTANLANPVAGSNVDVAALNNRNWIDVLFPDAPAGYQLDHASITDLDPEFRLSGPVDPTLPSGLGTIVLDASQAPVFMSATGRFRYWLTGAFASDGDVLLTFLPGTWAYARIAAYSDAPIVAADETSIYVTFPADPNGYADDPASILDLTGEFTLTPVATYDLLGTETEIVVQFPHGTYEVDASSLSADGSDEFVLSGTAGTPTLTCAGPLMDTENPTQPVKGVFRYTLSGTFTAGQLVLTFNPGTWLLVDRTVGTQPTAISLGSHPGQNTLEITFPTDALGHAIALGSITDSGAEFTLSGAGLGGATLTGTPTLKPGTQRTYVYSLSQDLIA